MPLFVGPICCVWIFRNIAPCSEGLQRLGSFWFQVGRRLQVLIWQDCMSLCLCLCCWDYLGTRPWWGKRRGVGSRKRTGGVTWWLSSAYEQRIFLKKQEKNWVLYLYIYIFFSPVERSCGWYLLIIRKGLGLWGISAAAGTKEGSGCVLWAGQGLGLSCLLSLINDEFVDSDRNQQYCFSAGLEPWEGIWISVWSPR